MNWLAGLKKNANFRFDHGNFTVLDCETTGFDFKKDRILSIGLVKMRGGNIQLKSSVEIFIKQQNGLQESAFIHGITKELLASGLLEQEALEHYLKFIGDDILVAHYALFDRNMLEEALRRQGFEKPANSWLDTMDLEVANYPDHEGNAAKLKLDALLEKKNISAIRRHTALGDAYSTALLLQKQLKECAENGVFESNQLHGRRNTLL
jgi:DNA polymerase-3 subunit epsilon